MITTPYLVEYWLLRLFYGKTMRDTATQKTVQHLDRRGLSAYSLRLVEHTPLFTERVATRGALSSKATLLYSVLWLGLALAWVSTKKTKNPRAEPPFRKNTSTVWKKKALGT